jgi:hypothetical protein
LLFATQGTKNTKQKQGCLILCDVKSLYLLINSFLLTVLLMGCAAQATPNAQPTPQPTAEPTQAPTVAAPTTEPKPTEASSTNTTAEKEFLPQATSVWNTTIGPDTLTGDCTASMLPVYGLVQITPKGNEIEWKNQEPKPYTLAKTRPNEYAYSGPTSINDGIVTMTVTIVDDKSLKMVREFVSSKEPACMHMHDYAGEFKWTR